MTRRRVHSLDDLLDVAERLVTAGGPAGLTLRALAASAGASNGSLYHAFRSKEELLARLWLRATERLGAIMEDAVRPGGVDGVDGAAERVVAVALAPVELARAYPASAQLFFAQRGDQLFSADLAPEIEERLGDRHKRLVTLLITLADGVWGRRDRVAVEAMTACVVDIPGGLLRRALLDGRGPDDATGRRIEAAVRAVLAIPLDPPPKKVSERS